MAMHPWHHHHYLLSMPKLALLQVLCILDTLHFDILQLVLQRSNLLSMLQLLGFRLSHHCPVLLLQHSLLQLAEQ